MRKIERFFAALLDHELRYDFPRLWFTKGKTLRASLDGGGDNSWRQTRSCWQRNRQMSVNKHLRQCGFCAACLLRRMSIHAVGLSEPADTYMYEDLAANTLREGVAPGFNKLGHVQHEYALAGILHLDHLASFQHSTGQGSGFRRSVLQLSAALNMPFTEVEANLRRLLSQHEAEWKSFVESLPPGSFIRSKSLQAA